MHVGCYFFLNYNFLILYKLGWSHVVANAFFWLWNFTKFNKCQTKWQMNHFFLYLLFGCNKCKIAFTLEIFMCISLLNKKKTNFTWFTFYNNRSTILLIGTQLDFKEILATKICTIFFTWNAQRYMRRTFFHRNYLPKDFGCQVLMAHFLQGPSYLWSSLWLLPKKLTI